MESKSEKSLKNQKSRQNLNLTVSECIRPFELHQQFPSTVKKIIRIKPNAIESKNVHNVVTVPMKFIQDGVYSEKNLIQISNPDDQEITLLDENLLDQYSDQGSWTIDSQPLTTSKKPQIKTITNYVGAVPFNNYRTVSQQELIKEKIHLGEDNSAKSHSSTSQVHTILSNLKKISLPTDQISGPKIIQSSNNQVIKKVIYKNSNILDQRTGKIIKLKQIPKNIIQFKNGQHVINSDKFLSVKPVTLPATIHRKRSHSPTISNDYIRAKKTYVEQEFSDFSGEIVLDNSENIITVQDEDEADDNVISTECISYKKPANDNIKHNDHTKLASSNGKLDIIQKALMSCSDPQLRAQALKVLQECNVGKTRVMKKVPIKHATKTICDYGTQTEVFSLLKQDEFLHVTEDKTEMSKVKVRKTNHPISTLSLNRPKDKMRINFDDKQFKSELDNMVEKIFPNSTGISVVKDALVYSKTDHAKLILEKLQKDFESAKNYDDDGLLGIHRAVMNNDIKEVQKNIMLLKATKQNIDVCTEDEKTSLEIAVDYEVNSHIVKVLLDAGAQPVSSTPIHDSAIILAAKTSSRVLPLLLKYINKTNKNLLNAKDEHGLAAIHYCAQRGNIEGISELLKLKVDPNIQDERSGRTPLYYAIDTKDGEVSREVYYGIAQKLIDAGAYSDVPMFSKHSCLSLIDDVKNHSLKIALNKAVQG